MRLRDFTPRHDLVQRRRGIRRSSTVRFKPEPRRRLDRFQGKRAATIRDVDGLAVCFETMVRCLPPDNEFVWVFTQEEASFVREMLPKKAVIVYPQPENFKITESLTERVHALAQLLSRRIQSDGFSGDCFGCGNMIRPKNMDTPLPPFEHFDIIASSRNNLLCIIKLSIFKDLFCINIDVNKSYKDNNIQSIIYLTL